MTIDLILAILHHLLVLSLAGLMFAELVLVRPGLSSGTVRRVARLDMLFGAAAGTLLVVGFLRVFLGLRPADFYLENPFFWAKMGAFAAVALLSIAPTIQIIRWRRSVGSDAMFVPPAAEVKRARLIIHVEATVFVLIPIFAAVMADGYGL